MQLTGWTVAAFQAGTAGDAWRPSSSARPAREVAIRLPAAARGLSSGL